MTATGSAEGWSRSRRMFWRLAMPRKYHPASGHTDGFIAYPDEPHRTLVGEDVRPPWESRTIRHSVRL
jgi:hypothetical protein